MSGLIRDTDRYPEDFRLWPNHPDIEKILRSEPKFANRVTQYTSPHDLPQPENLPVWIPDEVKRNRLWQVNFYEHPELTQRKYWTYDEEQGHLDKRVQRFNQLPDDTSLKSRELDLLWRSGLVPQVDRSGISFENLLTDLAQWGFPKKVYVEWLIPALNGSLVDWVKYMDERATPGTYLNSLSNKDFKKLTDTLETVEESQNFKQYIPSQKWTYTEDLRSLEDDPRVNEDYLAKIYSKRKLVDTRYAQKPGYPSYMPKMFRDFFDNPQAVQTIKKHPLIQKSANARKLKHTQSLAKNLLEKHNFLLDDYAKTKESHESYKKSIGEYHRTYKEDMEYFKDAISKNLKHLNFERKKLGLEAIPRPEILGIPKKRKAQSVQSMQPEVQSQPVAENHPMFGGQAYEDYLLAKASQGFFE